MQLNREKPKNIENMYQNRKTKKSEEQQSAPHQQGKEPHYYIGQHRGKLTCTQACKHATHMQILIANHQLIKKV